MATPLPAVWQDGILSKGIDPRGNLLPMYFEKNRQYGADLLSDMGSVIYDGARMLDEWHWDWKSVFQLNKPSWQEYWTEGSGRSMHSDDIPPKAAALTPEQSASLNEYLKLPIFDGNNSAITHQAGGWSDGEPLIPIPVSLTKDERDHILELIHSRSLQGPMPADEEGFSKDANGDPQPPTEATPGWRHVYYWDHERKKRQLQWLKDPNRGWEYDRAQQWNRDKNGWEDEGLDLGREYLHIDPNDAAVLFATVAGILASVLTLGAATVGGSLIIAGAIAAGMTGLGNLAVASANGQPVSAGDYLNLMFKMGAGVMRDADVQAGMKDMFSGVDATLRSLYKDVAQSSTVFSLTTKVEEIAKTLKTVADRIDVASLQRLANLMPPDQKAPFQNGINTFIDYRNGRIDRFLADKITSAEQLRQNLSTDIYNSITRIGYFQAAIADEQSQLQPAHLGDGSVMAMPHALAVTQTSQALVEAYSKMTFPEFMQALQKRYRNAASSTVFRY